VLDRYIGRAVIGATLLVLLVLLTLIAFVELEKELGEVGRGSYDLPQAFFYVGLVLPRFAYEIFPIATLLGSLVGLGAMANHAELIAMRAAGISLSRIVWAVMQAGLLLMALAVVVGELLAPESEQYAQTMRAEAISGQITLKTKYGFWTRDGDSYINIREFRPGAALGDVFIYEFDSDQHLKLASHAESARHTGDGWELENIHQSEFLPDRVRSRHLDRAYWKSLLNPALLDMVMVEPSVLPIAGLYRYIGFLRDNSQDASLYEVAFWGKITTPLVVLVMLLLSIPFVFGSLRSAGVGQRVFAGSVVGISFLLVNRAFAHMAVVYQLDPLFASVFPVLAVLGVALWYMRRL
jgi:lipopolysaccharide export system permease protein